MRLEVDRTPARKPHAGCGDVSRWLRILSADLIGSDALEDVIRVVGIAEHVNSLEYRLLQLGLLRFAKPNIELTRGSKPQPVSLL